MSDSYDQAFEIKNMTLKSKLLEELTDCLLKQGCGFNRRFLAMTGPLSGSHLPTKIEKHLTTSYERPLNDAISYLISAGGGSIGDFDRVIYGEIYSFHMFIMPTDDGNVFVCFSVSQGIISKIDGSETDFNGIVKNVRADLKAKKYITKKCPSVNT